MNFLIRYVLTPFPISFCSYMRSQLIHWEMGTPFVFFIRPLRMMHVNLASWLLCEWNSPCWRHLHLVTWMSCVIPLHLVTANLIIHVLHRLLQFSRDNRHWRKDPQVYIIWVFKTNWEPVICIISWKKSIKQIPPKAATSKRDETRWYYPVFDALK